LKKRLARKLAALAAPFGAASVFAVPGPCTTFDGIMAPDAEAGAPDQVSCGLPPFVFLDGPVGDDACQWLADHLCCVHQRECAGDENCSLYVSCIDECNGRHLSSPSKCYAGCGTPGPEVAALAACFYSPDSATSQCLVLPP